MVEASWRACKNPPVDRFASVDRDRLPAYPSCKRRVTSIGSCPPVVAYATDSSASERCCSNSLIMLLATVRIISNDSISVVSSPFQSWM